MLSAVRPERLQTATKGTVESVQPVDVQRGMYLELTGALAQQCSDVKMLPYADISHTGMAEVTVVGLIALLEFSTETAVKDDCQDNSIRAVAYSVVTRPCLMYTCSPRPFRCISPALLAGQSGCINVMLNGTNQGGLDILQTYVVPKIFEAIIGELEHL